MPQSLLEELTTQSAGELLARHGIDPSIFHTDSLQVGPAEAYLKGLEAWANKRNLATTHGQLASRANNWSMVRQAEEQAEGGWSLFSVAVNQKGWPAPGQAFAGHRIHPSRRTRRGLRFDVRGWHPINRGLMLPPFSLEGAIELMGNYGFNPDPDEFEPWQAWAFILENPEIKVFIEESALKAWSACSIGQLAVGINGINGWGQKGRSDRLHPFLKRLARNGRQIVVRFDRPESFKSQSAIQARKLSLRLEREGSKGGGWWTWLPHAPAKTDDFLAALHRGTLPREELTQVDLFVRTSSAQSNYRRLKQAWQGVEVSREFAPEDIFQAARNHRVVVLKGATGTAKSRAMVGALALLEADLRLKLLVLGLYHRSSLVHKGAGEFGVVNMSAPPGSVERQGLHESGTLRDGLFCCGEGAYKLSPEKTLWQWYWELRQKPRPTLLVLDEISQVLANWTMGGTEALRKIRAKALEALEGLLQLPCVRVWAADALVGDIEMEWLQGVTEEAPWLISSTYTRQRDLYLGSPGRNAERMLLLQLNDVARAAGRFWLGHGTVAGLHRLMDALPPAADGTELRVTGENDSREDPRVARFMADAELEGPNYSRVGFSPAVSCGISMAKTPVDLTAVVQEYCWQAEDVVQALNRSRNSHRRILIAPKVVPDAAGITKETNPRCAAKALKECMESGSLEDYTALLNERHPATRRAVAQLEARRNLECFSNDWCLRGLLKEEGYQIRDLGSLENDCKPANQHTATAKESSAPRTLEGVQRHRLAALQRLASGTSTLEREQREAKRLGSGGTFLDLAEVDVSEAWTVAQELALDSLIRAGVVHRASPEIKAVWSALTSLDKIQAKRVARALGGRADRIPGPMDQLDPRTIWPLVKALGFKPVKAGETRAEGKRWRLDAIELE